MDRPRLDIKHIGETIPPGATIEGAHWTVIVPLNEWGMKEENTWDVTDEVRGALMQGKTSLDIRINRRDHEGREEE